MTARFVASLPKVRMANRAESIRRLTKLINKRLDRLNREVQISESSPSTELSATAEISTQTSPRLNNTVLDDLEQPKSAVQPTAVTSGGEAAANELESADLPQQSWISGLFGSSNKRADPVSQIARTQSSKKDFSAVSTVPKSCIFKLGGAPLLKQTEFEISDSHALLKTGIWN